MYINDRLLPMQDIKYKKFEEKLLPSVDPQSIIGIRTPLLRSLAKEISGQSEGFLNNLPHVYYEENLLHGYLIERIKDYEKALKRIKEFLPYIDNWAVCDTCRPKVFKKYRKELEPEILMWLKSGKTYTVRYAIGLLLSFYLDEYFDIKYLKMAADVKTDDYYVYMMQGWYFATALAKHYESTLPYIEKRLLSVKAHNRTIQKAVESLRVSAEHKEYLKTLKIK